MKDKDESEAPGHKDKGNCQESSKEDEDVAETKKREVKQQSFLTKILGLQSNEAHEALRAVSRKSCRTSTGHVESAKAVTQIISDTTSMINRVAADQLQHLSAAAAKQATRMKERLENCSDETLGPYASPATCNTSDFDPIASAVHAGLIAQDDDRKKTGKDPID